MGINDATTDNNLEIIHYIEKKDNRIKKLIRLIKDHLKFEIQELNMEKENFDFLQIQIFFQIIIVYLNCIIKQKNIFRYTLF